jgi:hypothetical protein
MSLQGDTDKMFQRIRGDLKAEIRKAGKPLTLSDLWDATGHSLDQLRAAAEGLVREGGVLADKDARNRTLYRLPDMEAPQAPAFLISPEASALGERVRAAASRVPAREAQRAAPEAPTPAPAKRRGRKPSVDAATLLAFVTAQGPVSPQQVFAHLPQLSQVCIKRSLRTLTLAGQLQRSGRTNQVRYFVVGQKAPTPAPAAQPVAADRAPARGELSERIERMERHLQSLGTAFRSLASALADFNQQFPITTPETPA